MGRREEIQRLAEAAAKEGIDGVEGWITAREVMVRIGRDSKGDLYSVACALRRLAKSGVIEEMVAQVPGKHRIYEDVRMYRMANVGRGILMSWLQPVLHLDLIQAKARRVKGRASVR